MTSNIRGLLIVCSTLLATALFTLGYLTFSAIQERTVREDAASDARLLARLSFNNMYELMRTGWSREQLDAFLHSLGRAVGDSPATVEVYRGEAVSARYGPIPQPAPSPELQQVLAEGRALERQEPAAVRYLMPLVAESHCLGCHSNASVGDTLGAITVTQSIGPLLDAGQDRVLLYGLPAVPLTALAMWAMVAYINRRLGGAIAQLSHDIEAVNRVSDLRRLANRGGKLGFDEFAPLAEQITRLTERLRTVAVDREMLEFEIRLVEKFIITSEVVRDWRDYVAALLLDIDSVLPTYALFSLFKVGTQEYELEVFWLRTPSERLKGSFEAELRHTCLRATLDHATAQCRINHTVADRSRTLDGEVTADTMQCKSLVIDLPKIGGIVGIGLQPQPGDDPSRLPVIDGVLSTLLNVVGSVKAIHRYTRELEYYATRDPLTNLYNQRVFWELLDNEIARSARHENPFVLLLIDIDNFKSINDGHGHAFGDVYLQGVARILRETLRPDDMLARYGGDEFVALLPHTSIAEGTRVAERIVAAGPQLDLLAPDGAIIGATFSIGVAAFAAHARERKDLFLLADNMLYRAKNDGKNRHHAPNHQDLASAFREAGERTLMVFSAIEQERFEPFFQPIVDVASGRVEAYEVLCRLRDADGSPLAADDFVAMAERMGVMHRIDLIVMRKAIAVLADSDFAGSLFVNTSPRALVLEEFIPQVRRIVRECGIDPRRIVFEITERESIRHPGTLDEFIKRLTREGFRMAIDDFGSGFSSFHYLKRFPFDYLKIEGDFVANMLTNERDMAMVRSIAALAKELGIRCLAEHVESEEILAALKGMKLDLAQGYHVGRPAPRIGPGA